MFVSCGCLPLRLDAKTRRLPSRVSIGKPSKSGLNVIRVRFVPSSRIDVEVEVAALRVGDVRGEDDLLSSGQEVRGEVRGAVRGDGVVVRAVGVHDADLEGPRRIGVTGQVLAVPRQVFGRGRMVGAVDDLAAVVGEEGTAVVAGRVRQALHVRAVGVHRVDLEVSVARRREDDRLSVGRDRRLGVIVGGSEERPEVAPVGSGRVDVVVVERPDVAVRAVRPRRASRSGAEGRPVEDPVSRRKEVGAGRLAFAVRDAAAIRAVGVHGEDLVAGQRAVVGLEDQPCPIGGPVRLGILASERELADVGEELLLAGIRGASVFPGPVRRSEREGRRTGDRRAPERRQGHTS